MRREAAAVSRGRLEGLGRWPSRAALMRVSLLVACVGRLRRMRRLTRGTGARCSSAVGLLEEVIPDNGLLAEDIPDNAADVRRGVEYY